MKKDLDKNILHLKPPGNWLNDPNGFIYYKGTYHLFYQHFPYAPIWGTMHWGHATSHDLVHWEHQNIAVFPSIYEDQNGCYSGCAIEYKERMHLFYTGVHYLKTNYENIHASVDEQFEESQLTLVSDDGMHFDNFHNKHVIIPVIEDNAIGDRTHTRDPKVWRGKDAWYMILGSTINGERGRLLFYRSYDLYKWQFVNSVSEGGGFGWMCECPDYFEIDNNKVLMFSSMRKAEDGSKLDSQTICTLVDFDETTCTMNIPKNYQYFDYGLELYATQSTTDALGRRVLVAWLRMPKPVDNEWIGMLSIPRVVEVKNGHIYFRVHPDVECKFNKLCSDIPKLSESGYRICAELSDGDMINIGGYKVFRSENCICTDKTAVAAGKKGEQLHFKTPVVKDGFYVDIYVEPHTVEVFVNNGEYTISNYVYGLGNRIEADNIQNCKIFVIAQP